ncbi:MAG: MATE family efflux transporter [Proteobacteria bacterium]|nr:MATE family efflux transporter [Pseudomonadota bacterium]MBU1640652.1 MATE family efflux transporter [Pseudomonadota bacterium]
MGTAATMVMEFTDRVFLANYSVAAISAALPAGIAAFLCMSFLGGVGGYISIFIAQYNGAGRNERIGTALWQGLYFTLLAGLILVALSIYAAGPLFALAGHSMEVRVLEEVYFNILCRGAILHVASHTLSGFFTGRGMTRPVMVSNFVGMAVNIPLDYALINGVWGLPELGIAGAALATVISWGVIVFILAGAVFTKNHERRFAVFSGRTFDAKIFSRLLRFGIPGAMQFSIDIFAFTFFILIVGRIGTVELAATNIVLAINSLAFMPALGFSYGVSSLVGQALGRGNPDEARRTTWSAVHILCGFTLLLDLLFIFAPQPIIALFIPADNLQGDYAQIMPLATNLLKVVAAYILLDALYMTFSAVLKGAGDTRFIMWCVGLASLFVMLLPLYAGIEIFKWGIYFSWYCVLFYVALLFVLSAFRYRQGKWQQMLVVEREVTNQE